MTVLSITIKNVNWKKNPDVFGLRDTWIETPRPSIPDPSRQHAFNENGSITYDRGNVYTLRYQQGGGWGI